MKARDSYMRKFDRPFTAWLYGSDVTYDQEYSDGMGAWLGLVGKRIMFEDPFGFVTCIRFVTVEDAVAVFNNQCRLWDAYDNSTHKGA